MKSEADDAPVLDERKYGTLNRSKVYERMAGQTGVALLNGGGLEHRRWTDTESTFRQESYFYYLTGIREPGYSIVLDMETCRSILYTPVFEKDHTLWHGAPQSDDSIKERYGVDAVFTQDDLRSHLKKAKLVHVLDIGEYKDGKAEDKFLLTAIAESRVIKSEMELDMMRYAAQVSGKAHIEVMKEAKSAKNERALDALFKYHCARMNGHEQAYTPILAGGKRGAILHYNRNDADMPLALDELFLIDAGCEYLCYASDITRTYPCGGVFYDDYDTIYEIVLNAQEAVLAVLNADVHWEDMHRLAAKVILQGLLEAEIVQGTEKDLLDNHIAALFFPHGLGHLIGLDVHDCGGYPKGVERIDEPGIRYLRMRRQLKENMVVTVEPGVYFIDAILDPAVADPNISRFLNLPVLERFREKIGGVRIEDDVVILKDGIENLTGWIPKTIEEIEKIMNL